MAKNKSDVLIAIPSKNRIEKCTARKLFKGGVLFVEPQDYRNYRNVFPDDEIVVLKENDRGFGYVLNEIVSYSLSKGHEYFLFVDDDIFGLRRRDKVDFRQDVFLNNGVDLARKHGLAQLGVSFSGHNWYYKGVLKQNTAVWGMGFYNAKVIDLVGGYRNDLAIFNDYEITARLIKKGYRVASWYDYYFEHKMKSASGGASSIYESVDLIKKAISIMQFLYGNCVRCLYHKAHGIPEIRIRWNKLKG